MSRPSSSWLLPLVAFFAFTFTFGLAAVGCGPRWQVQKEAAPDPFLGKTTFALEALHFETLMVGSKSEAEWRADKDAESNAKWEGDKLAMNGIFQESIVGHGEGLQFVAPGPSVFIVRAVVNNIEPGFYAAVAASPTIVHLTVQLLAPDGQVLDEFVTSSRISATMTNPSSGGRLRDAGNDLGNVVAKYLKHRVFG